MSTTTSSWSSLPRAFVYIDPYVQMKIDRIIGRVNAEVGGIGKIEIDEDGDLFVTDIRLFKQKVSGGSVDAVENGPMEMLEMLMEEEGDQFDPTLWRFSWHSHANMSVGWSNTDEEQIEEWKAGSPWFVSLVQNKKGEKKCRIDFYEPFRCTAEAILITSVPTELAAWVDDEIKRKVEVKKETKKAQGVQVRGPQTTTGGRTTTPGPSTAQRSLPTRTESSETAAKLEQQKGGGNNGGGKANGSDAGNAKLPKQGSNDVKPWAIVRDGDSDTILTDDEAARLLYSGYGVEDLNPEEISDVEVSIESFGEDLDAIQYHIAAFGIG